MYDQLVILLFILTNVTWKKGPFQKKKCLPTSIFQGILLKESG